MNKIQEKDNGKFSFKSFFRLVGKIGGKNRIEGGAHEKLRNKKILGVAGDLGGWHALAVVLAKLADSGAKVFVIFTGPSRRAFEEQNLEIDSRFSVLSDDPSLRASHPRGAWAKQSHEWSLVIVAPSQSKDGNDETVETVNKIKGGVPICVIEDMWGSAVPFLRKIKPQLLKNVSVCVVDQFAKKMLVESTGIKGNKISVTGGPQFDRVLELKKNWDKQRKLIRENLADDCLVYLVAGGVNGTGEILSLVKAVLRPQDTVIFRQHSRSTMKDKTQTENEIVAIKQAGGKFLDIDKSIALYTESLLAGADFVLSGFSTTNRYAILLGIVGTIYVGTKSFKKDLWTEKKLKLPPEVEYGAGWYVKNTAEMQAVVEEVTSPVVGRRRNQLVKKQQKIAQFCDGKAVERVVEVIEGII